MAVLRIFTHPVVKDCAQMLDKLKAVLPKLLAYLGWIVAIVREIQRALTDNPLPEFPPADSTVAAIARVLGIG